MTQEELEQYLINKNYFKEKRMEYILVINEEEQKLLLGDLHQMATEEGFYDKDLAEKLYYKVLYAVKHGNDGNHISI